jgi:hypothetical protein
MAHPGAWNCPIPPPSSATSPGEICVFVIKEEGRVEQADVDEIVGPEEDSPSTPRKDINRKIKLTVIELKPTTISAVPIIEDDRSHVINNVT